MPSIQRARQSIATEARRKGRDAIRVLVSIMENEAASPEARIKAATELLNRGYGRPTQTVEGKVEHEISMADMHLAALKAVNRERRLEQARQIDDKVIEVEPVDQEARDRHKLAYAARTEER